MKVEMRDETYVALCNYLLAHEIDIELGINDFDSLREVFETLMKRPAGEEGVEAAIL